MRTDLEYTMGKARYAKNMIALQIPGVDGWKSLAAVILEEIAPNARHTRREHAYIVSKAQAARFVKAIEEQKVKELERSNPPSFRCKGCGREESACSANPCESVARQRES